MKTSPCIGYADKGNMKNWQTILAEGKPLPGNVGTDQYQISSHLAKKIKPFDNFGQPGNKKLLKLIQIALMTWLADDEQEKGKPDFSRQDDSMDVRGAWDALDNGDYDQALSNMNSFDTGISKMIKKLK